MKKKLLFILLGCAIIKNSSAQVVWGVGSANGVADAEFQNAFVQSTAASNYNATAWTALSVYDNNGTPGSAFWTRSTTGISQGAYATGQPAINSPSQVNGVAIFDSDFMDNAGTAGAFGTGTSPSGHQGQLISPRIDLTGSTNKLLKVGFYSRVRRFVINELSISLSTDDGATWGAATSFANIPATNALYNGTELLSLPANTTTGVSNLTQCRLRFTFDGDYYFSIVDDIYIEQACATTTSSITLSECDSLVSASGNYTYTASGTYNDTIANAAGCDSVITYNLTIKRSTSVTNQSACANYVSPSGNYTWITSGTYNDTIANAAGCDSIMTINLTINNNSSSISASTCANYVSPSGNYTWTTSGTYNDTIANVAGCDSVITVNLTINNTIGSITPTACGSYVSPSGNYTWTTSGTFNDTIPNMAGCDSIITVNLTINNVDTATVLSGVEITSAETGANYVWLDCSNSYAVITGETSQNFIPAANGSYAVEVTKNGCTDTSACVSILTVGIAENNFANVSISPNPTSLNAVTINFAQTQNNIKVIVLNAIGQQVFENKSVTAQKLTVDLNGNAGLYFIKLISKDGNVATYKVIKE